MNPVSFSTHSVGSRDRRVEIRKQDSSSSVSPKNWTNLATSLINEFQSNPKQEINLNLTGKVIEILDAQNLSREMASKLFKIYSNSALFSKDPSIHRLLFEKACEHGFPKIALKILKYGRIEKKKLNNKNETLLHAACKLGNEEVVRALLTKNFFEKIKSLFVASNPFKFLNDQNETPLMVAYLAGHSILVEKLIKENSSLNRNNFDHPNIYGESLIHLAAYRNDIGMMRFLIKQGGQYDLKTSNGNTPLHLAAKEGNHEAIDWLINQGASVEAKNNFGQTPLHLALQDKVPGLESSSLITPEVVRTKDSLGQTPLHLAYLTNYSELIEILKIQGAKIDAKTCEGNTVFHFAIMQGNLSEVKNLMREGASINEKNYFGQTPLHLAFLSKNLDLISLLLDPQYKRETAIFEKTNKGETSLHLAISAGLEMQKIEEFGLLNKSMIAVEDHSKNTPFTLACKKKQTLLALKLIEEGALDHLTPEEHENIFAIACENGLESVMKGLIKYIKDINQFSKFKNIYQNETYLYRAYTSGNKEAVALLEELGAHHNHEIDLYNTYLSGAAKGGLVEAFPRLMAEIQEHENKIIFLRDAMTKAISSGQLESVKALLKMGAPSDVYQAINNVVKSGNVELFEYLYLHDQTFTKRWDGLNESEKNHIFNDACSSTAKPDQIVKMLDKLISLGLVPEYSHLFNALEKGNELAAIHLIQTGLDPSHVDENGNTPAHYAVKKSYQNLLNLLLEKKADLNTKNNLGERPIELINENNLTIPIIFYQAGASFDGVNSKGQSILHLAVKANLPVVVSFLIEIGKADFNLHSSRPEWITPKEYARMYELEEIQNIYQDPLLKFNNRYRKKLELHALLDKGRDHHQNNQLHLACISGDLEMIKRCIKYGLDVNQYNGDNQTPLYLAVARNNIALVEYLLSQGAKADLPSKKIYPLAASIFGGYDEITQMLLDTGVNLNSLPSSALTPYGIIVLKQGNSAQLSPALKNRIKDEDQGFTHESYHLRYLAHCFSLAGRSSLNGIEFNLERMPTAAAFKFYNDHLKIDYEELRIGEARFQRVWNNLSVDTQKKLRSKELLEEHLQKVPKIFSRPVRGVENELISISLALARENSLPLLVYGGWHNHSVGAVIYKNKLSRANRGHGSGKTPGVVTMLMKTNRESPNYDRMLPMLSKFSNLDSDTFISGIEKYLEPASVHVLFQKPQKVANCSVTSLRSAEFAIFFHLFEELLGVEAAVDLSKCLKRERTFQSRQNALERYLENHLTEDEIYAPDIVFLRRLMMKKKNEPDEVYQLRVDTILDWANSRKIKL